jgi:hypothetical protein
MKNMKLNGHELESRYISMIILLRRYRKNTFWNRIARFILKRKLEQYKVDLTGRLRRLDNSYKNGLISKAAYLIWKRMINEAL